MEQEVEALPVSLGRSGCSDANGGYVMTGQTVFGTWTLQRERFGDRRACVLSIEQRQDNSSPVESRQRWLMNLQSLGRDGELEGSTRPRRRLEARRQKVDVKGLLESS
ncbi:uncharacterized protein V6R79_024875 [Siganus canaliculatus]